MSEMTGEDWRELAKIQQAAFQDRRKLEWELLLGYWGSLGLIAAAFLAGKVSADAVPFVQRAIWFVVPVVIACCVLPLQRGHKKDQDFFKYFLRRAEGKGSDADRPDPRRYRINLWWTFGQILFSIFLTAVASNLISHAHPMQSPSKKAAVSATEKQP